MIPAAARNACVTSAFYLTRDAQDMLDSGGIVSVKPRAADLLCVKIDVEPVAVNRGLYSVDSRFFYRIECEVSCAVGGRAL